jgi:hypothetical protein
VADLLDVKQAPAGGEADIPQLGEMRVRNRSGVARLPFLMIFRPEISDTRSRRPRLSQISWSRKIRPDAGMSRARVTKTPPAAPAAHGGSRPRSRWAVNGYGKISSSRAASVVILASSRPPQIAWTAATSSTAANALSSGTNPTSASAACRWAYSLPLISVGRYMGEVAGELHADR